MASRSSNIEMAAGVEDKDSFSDKDNVAVAEDEDAAVEVEDVVQVDVDKVECKEVK